MQRSGALGWIDATDHIDRIATAAAQARTQADTTQHVIRYFPLSAAAQPRADRLGTCV